MVPGRSGRMVARPRVLVVTRNLPPLTGGMERLNWHLIEALSDRFDVEVVGPSGSASLAPAEVVVSEVRLRPLSAFLLGALRASVRRCRHVRPSVVLAGSGLTAPIAWFAARLVGASAVTYIHGLDITVPNRLYRLIWLPFIRRMCLVIVNSSATRVLALQAGVPADRVCTVHPGVSLPTELTGKGRRVFRERHGLNEDKVLLSVGRLTERKGLLEFVEGVLPLVVARSPSSVRLVVIGDEPKEALHAKPQTWEAITAAARRVGVADCLVFLGKVSQEELDEAYVAADVLVFPVRQSASDPEGFGMVAIEAAAHGLPTVAYATGGVVDAVADGRSGRLVTPGDVGGFVAAVVEQIEAPIPADTIRDFAARFAWHRFGEQMSDRLQGLIRGAQ